MHVSPLRSRRHGQPHVVTSAQHLLDKVASQIASPVAVDVTAADDAARALRHLGRALAEIGHDSDANQDPRRARRRLVVEELATACQRAAAQMAAPAPGGSHRSHRNRQQT